MMLITAAKLLLALASFQGNEPLMWTGESTTLPRPPEKDAPDLAQALRNELKTLVTRTDVQRDYPKQLEQLDMLRGVACWSFDYPGKAGIAAEIAEVRADWLEKLGRHADAVFAAQHVFVMPSEKDRSPYNRFVWAASEGRLAELEKQVDALPRIVALRKRFPADGSAAGGGDPIEQTVRRAIESGDPADLKSFGARCVPALVKVLSEMQFTDRFRIAPQQDPLTLLLQLDREAGCKLILATIGKRPLEWTAQVVRCVGYAFFGSGAWVSDPDPYTPPKFADPLMLQVVDAIAEQRMASPSFVQVVQQLVRNDVVTPALREFLLPCLKTSDPELLDPLHSMFDGLHVGPNKRDLYEACLESPDSSLRINAAIALQLYPVGPATLRAAQHADPKVRMYSLQALVTHDSKRGYYDNPHEHKNDVKRYVVARTPEIEAALLKLAHDGEASVRAELARALLRSGEAPPEAVLEPLLSDAHTDVRLALLESWSADAQLRSRIYSRLAADEDPKVLDSVAGALFGRWQQKGQPSAEEFARYLPAVRILLENPRVSVKEPQRLKNLLAAALTTPEGARLAFDICLRGPRREELRPLLLEMVHWTAPNRGDVAIQDVLPAPELAELFALDQGEPEGNRQEWTRKAVRDYIDAGTLDAAPFLALARDAERPTQVRLRLLEVAAAKAGPADGEAYLTLLRRVRPEEIDPENQVTRRALMACLSGFRTNGWKAPALAGIAPRLIADATVPDLLALRAASNALDVTREKLDAAATAACIERWGRLAPGSTFEASVILQKLDPRLDARVLRIWREELSTLTRCGPLLDAIYNFPVDESVDLLVEVITRTDVAIHSEHRQRAVSLLTRRLDDLGADALLKAIASTSSGEVRQKCFEGLEQIRKYQDEKQSWQLRKGGEAARAQAVADLLPMLADKDAGIRAAAARSLATLRAVEHLPRIVALLKDKDEKVREAAQKALDALNAPVSNKP